MDMERIMNKAFQQVFSRCYKHLLRNIGTSWYTCTSITTRSKSDRAVPSYSWQKSVERNCLSKCIVLPRHMCSLSSAYSSFYKRDLGQSGNNMKFMDTPGNLTLVRNFSSEPPAAPKPNPLPKRKTKSKEKSGQSPITWTYLLLFGGIAGAVILGMRYIKQEKEEARRKAQYKKTGTAKLGGEWTLTDHNGKLRSSRDFHGQWLLIYFGFTNCPDICPEEVEKIVGVIEKTDADGDLPKIQPIMITVDPVRDTPEALKEYCSEFSPRLLGFSGTDEQIQAATRAYRVYYSAGPKDEDNDYIVDHSIISYLINPEGDFVEYFGQNKKVAEIYSSTKLHILSYLKKKSA